jgi:hypothetical protein
MDQGTYLVQILIPGTYLTKFRQVSGYICIQRNHVTFMELLGINRQSGASSFPDNLIPVSCL